MTTSASYSLGHEEAEYVRVRAQALAWEQATVAVLDRIDVPEGGRCLDAGSGPGEVMRLLAERVGPAGHVTGVDADPGISARAEARLRDAGFTQCEVVVRRLAADVVLPGDPYDVVFTRLLLFHLPDRDAVLARLWDAVAPGGCLVVQEYDVRAVATLPELDSFARLRRLLLDTFVAVGADPALGARLPGLFVEAGVGAPDDTDVAGRLEPLPQGQRIALGTARSLAPAAAATGVMPADEVDALLADAAADVETHPDATMFWPLLVSAWKRRPAP